MIQSDEGRPLATIGYLDDDMEGNLIKYVAEGMSYSTIFLREVMASMFNKHEDHAEGMVGYLYRAPIFKEDRKSIIAEGIKSYVVGNHLVAAHILIPQVEEALRSLAELSGSAILRQNRVGGFQYVALHELLKEASVIKILGDDMTWYFRILFTDQRGWNLRNNICHELVPQGIFGTEITDRIVHALICLGTVRHADEESTL